MAAALGGPNLPFGLGAMAGDFCFGLGATGGRFSLRSSWWGGKTVNEREQEQASLLFRMGGFKSRNIWLDLMVCCDTQQYMQKRQTATVR